MNDLITTIRILPMLVGCKDFPDNEEGVVIVKLINDFINEEYGYTSTDVIAAFKMAVKRELYLDGKRVDPSTFGQYVSLDLVGKVLTAYKELLAYRKSQPANFDFKQLSAPEPKKITPKEAHEFIIDCCERDGKLPDQAPYIFAYLHLLELNEIREVTKDSKGSVARRRLLGEFVKVEISPKEKAASNWYTKNVIDK